MTRRTTRTKKRRSQRLKVRIVISYQSARDLRRNASVPDSYFARERRGAKGRAGDAEVPCLVSLTASPLRLTSPLPLLPASLLPASSLRARPFAPFARSILRNPTAYCLLFVITNEI